MKTILSLTTLSALALAIAAPALGQDANSVVQTPLPVGTCINMGNSLEPPQEGSWGGNPISKADFERIKAAGFDTVRIPVRWHNKSLSEPPYTVDPDWMARVVQVVDWALAADLQVILNSHHFDPIHEDPLGTAAWHGGVWKQIAERFAGYPEETLWFELENEPHKNFNDTNLLETLAPALAAVRASHPTRAVIYGGEEWSGVNSLATLKMPDDPNIHATFHYYDPFAFTHQGASWTAPNIPPPGRKFGSAADKAALAADVEKVRAFIARTGKVPFMGETGAYDLHISTAERAAYHRAVTQAFAPTGIGICIWAYSNTYPFFDAEQGQWLEGLRDAAGLDEPGYVRPQQVSTAQPSVPAGRGMKPKGQRVPKQLASFEEQLPGWLLNDPSTMGWVSYGSALSTASITDDSVPGGGAATRYTIRDASDPWSAATNIPLIANVEEGRRVVIGFWARAIESEAADASGLVTVRFQQDAEPYPGFGDTTLSIGKEWNFYEVAATADRDIKRQRAVVVIQLGARKQTVEIGQAIALVGASSITK